MKNQLQILFMLFMFTFHVNAQTFTTYNTDDFNDFIFDDDISNVAIASDGKIWVSSGLFGIGVYDGTTFKSYRESDGLVSDFVRDIKLDASDNVWVCTSKGLVKMNASGNILATYDSSNTIIPGIRVNTVEFAPDGRMWVSSENTFDHRTPVSFDGTTWTAHDELMGNALGDEIHGYAFDGSTVWMASDVGVLEYKDKVYKSYFKAHTGLWTAYVAEKDASGDMWFVGNWGVLNNKNDKWNFTDFKTILPAMENDRAFAMKIQGNYMWIGTNNGLYKYNMSTNAIQHWDDMNSDLPSPSVYDLAIDSKGDLWMATPEGLVHMAESSAGGLDKIADGLEVFPNPATKQISIHADQLNGQKVRIDVIDILGSVVNQSSVVFDRQATIDLSEIKPGAYFIKVYTSQGIVIRKITKS